MHCEQNDITVMRVRKKILHNDLIEGQQLVREIAVGML